MRTAKPKPSLDDRIRARAHQIWQQSGQPDGQHLEHWQQAEAELTVGSKKPAKPAPAKKAKAKTKAAAAAAKPAAKVKPAKAKPAKTKSAKAEPAKDKAKPKAVAKRRKAAAD